MFADSSIDDELVKRLPLPLAKLYINAHNAQSKPRRTVTTSPSTYGRRR